MLVGCKFCDGNNINDCFLFCFKQCPNSQRQNRRRWSGYMNERERHDVSLLFNVRMLVLLLFYCTGTVVSTSTGS